MDRRYALLSAAFVAMLALVPVAAHAASPASAEQPAVPASSVAVPVEGFMRLTGRIVVGADRRVSGFAIDRADQVPDEIKAFLSRQAADWRVEFDPEVAPPTGPVRFSVRLRASPAGDGQYGLWLDGVHLEEPLPEAQRMLATRKRWPEYPRAMAKLGASGIVYMLALVGTDGRVEEVFAEQVDLTVAPADAEEVVQFQLEFMASAASAARRWRFRMPAEGPDAGRRQALRIPMVFAMHDRPEAAYGEWEYVVRGVRKSPSWAPMNPGARGAMASAGVMPARSRMWVANAGDGREG